MAGICENKHTYLLTNENTQNNNASSRQIIEYITIQSNINHLMVKHLLETICECCGANLALHIAHEGGFFAGEDFSYKYLDLQDNPDTFCSALTKKNKDIWFPKWDLKCADTKTGPIYVSFAGMRGCRGKAGKKPPLQCEFMQGYILGILECYTGCRSELKVSCKATTSGDKQQCIFEIFPQADPSQSTLL